MTLGEDDIQRALAAAAELMHDDPCRVARVEGRARRTAVRRRALVATSATVVLAVTGMSLETLESVGQRSLSALRGPVRRLPDVAVVQCDGKSAKTLTPTVRPQPDGVHIEVRNTADWTLELSYSGSAVDVPPGETRSTVADTPPGRLQLDCLDPTASAERDPKRVTIDVRDLEGHYRPVPRECARGGGVVAPHVPRMELPAVQERAVWGVGAEISYLQYRHRKRRTVLIRYGDVTHVTHWVRHQAGWVRDRLAVCEA